MEEAGGDAAAEELDGFKDFTVSSSWERLIASVESVCQEWHSAGRKQLLDGNSEAVEGLRGLHRVHAEVSQGYKNYRLELYFGTTDEQDSSESGFGDWQFGLHNLQLWFGVKDFVVIAPVSLSGVLLDAPEATKLLSTVSIALSNCGSTWPVFVPVHDPTRKAYMGIESLQSCSSIKFEADKLGSQVPIKLMHLEGLYDLFISKLGYTSEDVPRLGFSMRLTYGTTYNYFQPSGQTSRQEPEEMDTGIAENALWDDDFPWAEWHSVEDPTRGFDLMTIWRSRYVSSSIEMAEFENASTFEADRWMLKPLFNRDNKKGGFAGRLRRLVEAFSASKEAEFLEDFVTVTKSNIENITRSCKVPPSTVLDRVLKDIFFQAPQASNYDNDNARLVKGAPPDSLFGRFCIHALWFGDCNIRAISLLWVEFVREVNWCWEEVQPLPRSSPDEVPDFATCLSHQKLQLLAKCIKLRKAASDTGPGKTPFTEESDIDTGIPTSFKKSKVDTAIGKGPPSRGEYEPMDADPDSWAGARRGSAGPVDNLALSKSSKPLHAPITQTPPIMTEDMLQEREQALAALQNSPSGKAARLRLQSDILASDMSAFKAANPGAILEDFVKWHSPRDWIEDDSSAGAKGKGKLSRRMAEPGNAWLQIWENTIAVPASEQKPIFDYMREGEKILHYLETLKPHQLLAQMICTAFVAATDVLWKTPGCKLQPILALFDEVYSVMAAVLAPLGSLRLSDKQVQDHLNEWERDLNQLCSTFETLEAAVAKAASLRQKLPQASGPLLSSLLNCGQEAAAPLTSYKERDMIADALFSHQSVTETWEESLRMGNFLNGHEPIFRETLFTFYEQDDAYGQSSKNRSNICSHRMYACGTADDLQIALASASHD